MSKMTQLEEEEQEQRVPNSSGDGALSKAERKRLRKLRKKQLKASKDEQEPEEEVVQQPADEGLKKKKKKKKKRKQDQKNDSEEETVVINQQPVKKKAKTVEAVASPTKKSKKAEAYREKNKITVEGDDIPKPYSKFEHARKGFNGVALPVLNECCKTFEKPSPIQAQAWPVILKGRDMIGIAETGSGKTLAFLLPCIARMLNGDFGRGAPAAPRALIIAPTRELALQSHVVAEQACRACEELSSVVVFGGNPKWEQRKLIEGCATLDILVATPGRLLDFTDGGVLDLSRVSYMVLDEADRMLDMGFEKDVRRIISLTVSAEKGRQTVMFSATWPQEIRELASTFMKNPIKVVVGSDQLSASKSVTQNVEVVEPAVKERKLLSLLRRIHDGKNRIIVFGLYKKEAARLESLLHRNNFKVVGVHGDKNQSCREEAVRKFKQGDYPILVATDVASRGLDIKGVEYVINVTFPLTVEDYVHRIGRTGRAGAKGEAFTFFTVHDKKLAGALQNVLREAGEAVPPELAKFGNTVKKKEHKLYGAHYKADDGPVKQATHITFSDDDE